MIAETIANEEAMDLFRHSTELQFHVSREISPWDDVSYYSRKQWNFIKQKKSVLLNDINHLRDLAKNRKSTHSGFFKCTNNKYIEDFVKSSGC